MMLVIQTQCLENYAWNKDGSIGQGADAYWKAKGGSSWKITGVPNGVDLDEIVTLVKDEIEQNNDYFKEYIIGYGLESDDWISDFERNQLEYDGEIEFREPEIEYSDLPVWNSIRQYEDMERIEQLAAEAY